MLTPGLGWIQLTEMRLCVVSSKECWRDSAGRWHSTGGFPLQIGALASLFDQMTIVSVGAPQREGGMPLPEQAEVIPLRRPAGTGAWRKLSVLLEFPYYLGTIARHVQRSDVVYVSLPDDISSLGMVVAVLLGRRLITRYAASWTGSATTKYTRRITRGFMRRFAGGRNVMLATGVGAEPPAERMAWVFATALSQHELGRIVPEFERDLSTPPRLAYAGRLSPEKGVRYLLEAVALLKQQGFKPLPVVRVAGDGPQRRELVDAARALGCDDLVTFVGQLDRDALSDLFGWADFYVHPSLTESYGKVLVDAMAHGLPILSTKVGAAPTLTGPNEERGWLVPPGSAGALAAEMRKVISDSVDWPTMRRRCRAYVEELTLENWARLIGQRCAQQWGMSLTGGKLRP